MLKLNIGGLKMVVKTFVLFLFLLLTTIVNAQTDFTTIHYRGIRPDDWNGLMPVRNPGRGFSLQDTIDLSLGGTQFQKKLDSTAFLKKDALKYASDSITMVQTTLFLPANKNKPIADSVLKGLQIYFDTLRAMGTKCVLHIIYRAAPGSAKIEKLTDVLHYPEQLQQLLDRNKGVILEVQDGLMGTWNPWKGGSLMDGYKVAQQLRLRQMTSFMLVSNNRGEGDAKKYAMESWRNVPVGPDQLIADKMPFSDDYFKSSAGNIVQRPLFDYILDHLGYRIELQQLMLPAKRPDNSPIHLKLELLNRGFSTVKQPCTVAFVLIDPTGKVYELPADGDPASWQPYAAGDLNYKPVSYFIEYKGKLPLRMMPGRYKLGVWIADASTALHYDYRYDIRCANGNVGWWISRDGQYGINILTGLTISK